MPDLVKDGPKFFPNVLRDSEFQKHGILFGINAGGAPREMLHGMVPWAVIDPRKHILYVWQKKDLYFPDSGVKLGSSVFTNGSFNVYKGGNTKPQKAAAWLMVNVFAPVANGFFGVFGLKANVVAGVKYSLYVSDESEGFIIGNREGISEKKPQESRPTQHHFGRKQGRYFEDYDIAVGDPPNVSEWIGGLFRTLNNYQFAEPEQFNTFGIWGLAPLDVSDPEIRSAVEEYMRNEPRTDGPPLPKCTGLLIAAFWSGSLKDFATILANDRVMDAARIDGSDSIVMGRGNGLVFDGETEKKKMYNRWGFQCQAG